MKKSNAVMQQLSFA